jgi:rRNA-processing protein FCF1
MGKPKKVLLDTNFIIDLFRFKIDFSMIEELLGARCSLLMVKQSAKELSKIGDKYAKVALEFLGLGRIGIVSAPGSTADDAIISYAVAQNDKKDFFVATNDIRLRKRLKESDVRVIYIRARKHLRITC